MRSLEGQDYELSDLEAYLEATFQPVKPRPGFVSILREKLLVIPIPVRSSLALFRYALLGIAGLVSSLIILVTGIRATVTVLGTLGILHHIRGEIQKRQTAQIQSTP